MEIDREFHTDVLVVGGGAAAMRAALAACDAGASTTVVLKGRIGRSGATVSPDSPGVAWQVADDCVDGDSPDRHARNIVDAGLGMADPRLAQILAEEVIERTEELERWGLSFVADPKARRRHYSGYSCFADSPRAHGIANAGHGHAGEVVHVLAKQLKRRSLQLHQDVFIADLIVEGERCLGAWGLGPDGEILVYRAGAVVLAAGGARQIFPPEPGRTPIDTTGDSYAMALRAGAQLTNMEFTQFMLHPVPPFPVKAPGVFWALCPTVRNRHGEDALAHCLPKCVEQQQVMRQRTEHYPFSSRDASKWLDVAFASELRAGRGTDAGGLYLDFSRVDRAGLRPSRPQHLPEDFSTPIELPENWVQVRPAAHAINGGVRIDEWGESTIAGLFAVAEAATGPHGADRLGGGMVSGGQVFAARAGRAAADRAAEAAGQRFPPDPSLKRQFERFLLRAGRNGNGRPPGDESADDLCSALQKATGRYLIVLRNQQGLHTLAGLIREMIEERFPRIRIARKTDRRRAIEVYNSLVTAELMTRAALVRRESRGSHFREDFPYEKEQWRCNIILYQSEHGLRHSLSLSEQADPSSISRRSPAPAVRSR